METTTKTDYEIQIKAPIGGTFFAYPIIKVGDKIIKSQKIYTIKTMGTNEEVKSEYSGIVKKISVKDGAKVYYNDLIMLIEVDKETFEEFTANLKRKKEIDYSKNRISSEQFSMKDFILEQGRGFFDFIAGLDVVISILILIAGIIMGFSESSWATFWSYTGIAFLYYQITLIKNYAIYLFIDMRDSLKELTKAKD